MDATIQLNAALAGRYEIEREIGRGGMATVYLARDVKHERLVAIKVLNPELGAVLGVERFLSEIRVTANLQHPHLLPLFDSGEADGLLYYVMPYVDGESLRARLDREKQLPIDEALRLTVAVLSALEYAHEHGVIHRDLKPENILLQSGEAVVADFGIALAVSKAGGARVTQTGLSLGTPQYMSPEQATGDRTIDARSDVYSMGAVLYEMLAGEPPHTGGTVQAIIAKVITERPRSLRLARDTVPQNVDDAVSKALAKLSADRWFSARDFADALRGALTLGTLKYGGSWSALRRRAQRALQSAAMWRAAAAVMLLTAAAFAWLALRPPENTGELQLARQLTFEGNVVATAISRDGGWLAYVTDDCYGKEFSCTYTLKVREVDGTQSVKLVTWPLLQTPLRWSPDGSTVLFSGAPDSTAPALYISPRLGGTPQRIPVIGATAAAFAPNGTVVVVNGPPSRQSMSTFDPRALTRTDSVSLPAGFAFQDLDFTPDGDRIAASVSTFEGQSIALLDARGKLLDSSSAVSIRPIIRWDASHTGIFVVSPSPGTPDNFEHIPVSGGHIRRDRISVALGQVPDGVDGIMDVAASGRMALVAGPTAFQILTLKLGDPAAKWVPLSNHTGWVWSSAFSPDGSVIAGSATDNLGDNVYMFPLSGHAPVALTEQRGIRDYPFWSADGRHLAYNALNPDASLIGAMITDADGGRERMVYKTADRGYVVGWIGNDALVLLRDHVGLNIVDTTGRVRSTLMWPDSLAPSGAVYTDPVSRRSAYWSANARGIVIVDLSTGRFTRVFSSKAQMRPVGWAPDGSLWVTTDVTADAGAPPDSAGRRRDRVLGKIGPGGAGFVRVATLPGGCVLDLHVPGLEIDAAGTRASCTVRRYTPDVWLADRAGKSGW